MYFNEIGNISINIFIIDFKLANKGHSLKVECGLSEIKHTKKQEN